MKDPLCPAKGDGAASLGKQTTKNWLQTSNDGQENN